MLLNETLDTIVSGNPLVPSGAQWDKHLYTTQELALAQRAKPTLDALEAIHDSILGTREDPRQDRVANPRVALG